MARRRYPEEFKRMVGLDALRNEKSSTLAEIAGKYGVSASMVSVWKKRVASGASQELEEAHGKETELQARIEELERLVEEKSRECEYLKNIHGNQD